MSSSVNVQMDQEQEISTAERQDPLFSAMNQVAAKLEELKLNDPTRKFTNRCKFCGNSSTSELPPPKKILTSSDLDVPIAPGLSEDARGHNQENLKSSFAALKKAEEALDKAKKDLEEARKRATQVLTEAKLTNQEQWTSTMTVRFTAGQMVMLTTGEIVRIEEVHKEKGRLTISPAKYNRDASISERAKRKISVRAVRDTANVEITRAIQQYEQEKAEHLSLKSQGCPSPCSSCGHAHCYTYHYANRSDLGGWEVLCCSPTCQCFNCKDARKSHSSYEYKCCNCSLDPYCECAKHRGW